MYCHTFFVGGNLMSKLIVLSGVPGSGKSYFSNAYKDKKGSHTYIVSSDRLRKEVTGDQRDHTEETVIWTMYYELVKAYSVDKKGTVILDSTNIIVKDRTEHVSKVRNLFDEAILVVFKIDESLVRFQNTNREFPVPIHIFENMINNYEQVTETDRDFYDRIVEIKDHNFDPIINELL